MDLDALYSALNAAPHNRDHEQPAALRPFAFDARDAVIKRLFSGDHVVRAAWIISSAPKRQQRQAFKARGVRVVMVSADRSTCEERARRQRPAEWVKHIGDWFTAHEDGTIDQTVSTSPPPPPIRAGSGRDAAATPTGEPHGAYHRG